MNMKLQQAFGWRWLLSAALGILLTACAGVVTKADTSRGERNFNAPSLSIDTTSQADEVLYKIPLESLMERFETLDGQGRRLAYVAFTDTRYGALLFVDGRLQGSVSKEDARAFYVCRGYLMQKPERYWGQDSAEWLATLMARVHPETAVQLDFSGKSTGESIKSTVDSPLVGGIRSLLGMGSNPLKIFSTLSKAREQYEASAQYEEEEAAMARLHPGDTEKQLVDIVRPQALAFAAPGMILSYPGHRSEFWIVNGRIQLIQAPSFYFLSRTNTALFYLHAARWDHCTPQGWPELLETDRVATQQAGVPAEVPAVQ